MAETSASKLAKRIQTDGSTHYKSTTAPASAVTGDIWFDTSSNSNRLKIYDGTSWVTSASLANARGSGVGDAGTTSAGLVFGGDKPDGDESVATEEFTPETTALNLKTLTDS